MHIKRNLDGTSVAELTYEEGQTYTLLGILATMNGRQELQHAIKVGRRSINGRLGSNLVQWLADRTPEDKMLEMRDFRNKLLHGLCIVFEDGSISISDEQRDDENPESDVKYTFVQLSGIVNSWIDLIHVDESLIAKYQAETGNPHPIQMKIHLNAPETQK